MNVLFICSRNKRRSLTAEIIFKTSPHAVRSAGTSDSARVTVGLSLIDWADMIFVMEKRHKQILQTRFQIAKDIIILDISDEYEYMDEELIGMLQRGVAPYLD